MRFSLPARPWSPPRSMAALSENLVEINSDLQWSPPASLFSQLLPWRLHHLFCQTRTIPPGLHLQAALVSLPALTSFTPSSFQPQSPHPPVPPSPPSSPCLPVASHPLSSCPWHLQQEGERKSLTGLTVTPHPPPPLLPPPSRSRFLPTKGWRQRLCETSCLHLPFPLPSAGSVGLCLCFLFLQVRVGT